MSDPQHTFGTKQYLACPLTWSNDHASDLVTCSNTKELSLLKHRI